MVVSCWFNHHHVIFFGGANSHNPCCRSEISIANIVKMSKLYRAPLIVEVAVGIHQDFYRGHGMVGWMLWLFCFAGRDGFPQTRAQQMGSGWWTYSKKKSYRLSEILGVRGGHNLFALFFSWKEDLLSWRVSFTKYARWKRNLTHIFGGQLWMSHKWGWFQSDNFFRGWKKKVFQPSFQWCLLRWETFISNFAGLKLNVKKNRKTPEVSCRLAMCWSCMGFFYWGLTEMELPFIFTP